MTRQEFIDNITTWDELIDFCNDNGCDYCENIYSEYDRDIDIDDNYLVDMARDADGWKSLCDELNNIPTGYDYYRKCNDEWYGLDDDDFDEYKDDVHNWAEEDDIFDDDEEEEEEGEPWYVDDDDFTPPDESISIVDLITSCNSTLREISDNAEKAAAADEHDFRVFVGGAEVTDF